MNLRRLFFEGEIMRLMGITMLVKPLALVTQVLTARYFGASAQLDAYTFSLFLVTFLGFTLNGVFSSVVIPQISRVKKTKTEVEIFAYQNAVGFLFFLPVVLIVLVFLVRGDLVIDLVGSKLPQETKQYAYQMLRFLAIPVFLFCLVKLNSSLLNLYKKFKIPAAMLPLHSVFLLLALVFLHGRLGIWALPVGWAASYFLQGLILSFQAFRSRIIRWVRPTLTRPEANILWALAWTVLIAQSLLMINTFIDKWFAAGLPVGSISYVNYSMVLIHFGQQVFSLSLVVVMFTRMSELLAENQVAECDSYIQSNLLRVSLGVVPISLALFVACPEIVRVLFQRGAFTAYDAQQTSSTLSMYLLGLPAIVINGIVARVFHSLQKMRERIWLTLQYLLTNVVGNIILVKTLATVGLAISSTLAINLHLLLSVVWIHFFGLELKTGKYLGIIGTSYALGVVSFLVYTWLGIGSSMEGWLLGDGLLTTMLLGALKVAVVLVLYGIQALGLLWFYRRRRG